MSVPRLKPFDSGETAAESSESKMIFQVRSALFVDLRHSCDISIVLIFFCGEEKRIGLRQSAVRTEQPS